MPGIDPEFQQKLAKEIDSLSAGSILETLPDGTLLLDTAGQATFVNDKFSEITGYELADLVGLPHPQLVELLVLDGNGVYADIRSHFDQTRQGQPTSARRRLRHKKGFAVAVELTGYPVRDRRGQAHGVLLICKDLHSELMVKVTSTINSSLQLQDVLRNTTRAVVDYLGLYSNAVFLMDKGANCLKLISCNVYEKEEDLPEVCVPLGVGAPGKIAEKLEPVYVANLGEETLTNDSAASVETLDKFKGKSSIGYPLLCRGELLGVMAFDADSIREFSEKEKALFESVAGQVALAIYNAQLFAKLEHLSVTDGLTGLYNHRYFQDRLVEELNRAKRNANVISLLMLDIDYFKNYNDCFGHPQGDQLLKGFAGIVKASVRNFDVVCRYGGEEFAVILPDCRQEEALNIAERIRCNCERYEFFGRDRQPGGRVTVSVGVANYPKATTREELVLFADRALYGAKHHNRNRVEVYS